MDMISLLIHKMLQQSLNTTTGRNYIQLKSDQTPNNVKTISGTEKLHSLNLTH